MKYYIVLEVDSNEYDEPVIHLLTEDKSKAYSMAERLAQEKYRLVKSESDNEVHIEKFPKYWYIEECDGSQRWWSCEYQVLEKEAE